MTWLKAIPVLLWLAAFILVGWILSQLPLAAIAQTIRTLAFVQWLAWIGLNLGIIVLATQRWWVLTSMLKSPVGFGELLRIRQAGQAVSFITPGPQFGGEPLQIFWLYKRNQLPIHKALLTVGLDRFYELWVNFSILLLAVLLLLISPTVAGVNWQKVSLLLALLLLMMSMLGWLLVKQPERVLSWITRVARHWQHHPRLEHIKTHWQQLGRDLNWAIQKQKSALFLAFILSLAGWIGLIGELWLLLSFFDLAFDVSAFLVILVFMRLAFLLPLPGGIGTLEAALFWAFQYLNLPAEAAIGLIALMRFRDVLVLMAGLWCLRLLHFR